MKNIFIFGSSGMLGNYVYSYLKYKFNNFNIIPFTSKNFDILNNNFTNLETLLNNFDIKNNDIIINCVGLIPQVISNNIELNTFKYFKINTLFPNWLALISLKYKINVIHASTDCVFDGNKGNYNENDIHTETNDYGKSKSMGENPEITIIRTSIVGEEMKNKRSLLEWVISNKDCEIKGYLNHYWNGITCYQYALIVEKIIEENLFWKGVRHIYSPTSVSKYELVNMINNIYDLNIKINKFKCDKSCDKTLDTIYKENEYFDVPELIKQIKTQKNESIKIFKV